MVAEVVHLFPPMTARFFRLEPVTPAAVASMQFEIYGVPAQNASDKDVGEWRMRTCVPEPGSCLNTKTAFPRYAIPMLKI